MEQLVSVILENSLNEIYVFEEDTYKFLYLNKAALKNIGYSENEILNLTPIDIKPEFTKEKFDLIMAPLKKGEKERVIFNTLQRRKDGTTYPVMVSLTKGRYNNKGVFLATIFDESELYREKEKFENMFRLHKAIMLLIDPETGEIIDANESAQQFYGFNLNELKCMKIQDINILSYEQVKCEMQRAKSEARNYFNFKHRLKNGKVKDVEVYSSPITLGDRSLLFSIIHDVSERAKLLEIIQAEQKLNTVGTLAAGIAHNFNNVFTVIYGYLDAIEALSTDKVVKDYIDKLWKVLDKSKSITSKLITFSEGGSPFLKTNNLDIFLLKIFQEFRGKYNIDVSYVMQQNLCELEFDDNQIRNAIEEIILNAVEASSDSKAKIDVKVDYADYTEVKNILPKKRYVKIVIKDYGKGINPGIIDKIFEPFFTTNLAQKRGLGLTSAYSILKHHGGTIKVKSQPNEGAEFALYLPCVK
ncbi:PAS domain S-box protein [Deferribacterales bacterium Es71-Z0220]|uniref:PAS domain S-box protein n=1 Tax=Deferrivibrio essentukiensis TaxID=2880922 RepID=UPI001F61A2FC|nr:PAS domain S-box protein [Deferrivibrio essentukiensis]MCB4203993.1 PAS domain S-box protein [Deferrivibrio essentukiensis]